MVPHNQMLVQTFLISTVLNAFADKSPQRTIPEKVARAALLSIPVTLTLDTTGIIDAVAEKFPGLGLSNCEAARPQTPVEMAGKVSEQVASNSKILIATFTRPEDQWKNPVV